MALEIKTATTIDEQIQRLKDRGMLFEDEQKAKETLLDIGYYRMGFYWFHMEKRYPNKENRDHCFKTGAKFETASRLYQFDQSLRRILSSYLLDIEVNIRTKVIYHISNRYKDNPTWFADNRLIMQPYINQLEQNYKTQIANNDVIKRHARKHINDKYAPAWKTLEYMSFGDLIRLIDNLKSEEDKKIIFNCYGLSDDKTFPNYVNIIRQLRNNCAHGHPIFDFIAAKSLRAAKFKKVINQKNLSPTFYSDLQGSLLVVQYFLYYLSGHKGDTFREEMKHLFLQDIQDDLQPIVGFLQNIPWLNEKL